MAQSVKALVVFAKDTSSIPSTHMVAYIFNSIQFQEM